MTRKFRFLPGMSVVLATGVVFCLSLLARPAQAQQTSGLDRLGAVNGYPNYKVAVIMAKFSDSSAVPAISGTNPPEPWTKEYIDGKFFTLPTSVSAFFREASNAKVSIQGQVHDNGGQWYSIPRPSTNSAGDCDWAGLVNTAIAAADPDIDFTQYNNVFIFTPTLACSPGGLATRAQIAEANNQYYRTEIVSGFFGQVPAHEMGHVIGLNHANFWKCPAPNTLYGSCTSEEYGDPFSIMSVEPWILLPAAEHRERLGWLASTEIMTVTKDGDYTIGPYEKNDGSPKVLKIPQSIDATGQAQAWYYLEYRQPIGFDTSIRTMSGPEKNVYTGALVHFGQASNDPYIRTLLLDTTPGSCTPNCDELDAALPVGGVYNDTTKGISFGVVSRDDASLVVRVRFNGLPVQLANTEPCLLKSPALSLDRFSKTGKLRSLQIYTLNIVNTSTVNCPAQKFTIKMTNTKKGWNVGLNGKKSIVVELASGKKAKINVRITSPKKTLLRGHYFTFQGTMNGQSSLHGEVVARYVAKK